MKTANFNMDEVYTALPAIEMPSLKMLSASILYGLLQVME
jgi:hypothetical protein